MPLIINTIDPPNIDVGNPVQIKINGSGFTADKPLWVGFGDIKNANPQSDLVFKATRNSDTDLTVTVPTGAVKAAVNLNVFVAAGDTMPPAVNAPIGTWANNTKAIANFFRWQANTNRTIPTTGNIICFVGGANIPKDIKTAKISINDATSGNQAQLVDAQIQPPVNDNSGTLLSFIAPPRRFLLPDYFSYSSCGTF